MAMRIYWLCVAILGVFALPLMLAPIMTIFGVITFGLGILFATFVINLFVGLLLLLPAVAIGRTSRIGGLVVAAATLSAVAFVPGMIRNAGLSEVAYLAPNAAVDARRGPRSVEMKVYSLPNQSFRGCEGVCGQILRSENLDWVRLTDRNGKTKVFERDPFGLQAVPDHGGLADVVIRANDLGSQDWPDVPRGFKLSRLPSGFWISDGTTGTILSKDVGVTLGGWSSPAYLFLDSSWNPFSGSTHVVPWDLAFESIATPPRLNLDLVRELRSLGLVLDEEAEQSVLNAPETLNLALNEVLEGRGTERRREDVVEEFFFQLRQGIDVNDRADLITRMGESDQAYLKRLITLFEKRPEILRRLAPSVARTVAQPDAFERLTRSIREGQASALRDALSTTADEIIAVFDEAGEGAQREVLTYANRLDPQTHQKLLAHIARPFPSLEDARATLSEPRERPENRADLRLPDTSGFALIADFEVGIRENDPAFDLAARALLTMIRREDLESDFVQDWIVRWGANPDLMTHTHASRLHDAIAYLEKNELADAVALLSVHFGRNEASAAEGGYWAPGIWR